MARWQRGVPEVLAMIEQGELQQLMGAAANGEQLLAKAVTTAQTAQSIVEADPDSAFVLA